jgi:hypothetical protein
LVLHLVVLFGLELNLLAALLELLLDGLRLLGFLPLGQENGLLDLALLVLPLFLKDVVALAAHLLALDVHLQVHNFLGLSTTRTYLLDLVFVSLLQVLDLARALLCLLDLLPSLHLLLLEESDTVGEQLCITLDPRG